MLLAGVLMASAAQAQDVAASYETRGIAPVADGNISAARAAALTDAQQKAVLAALADRMSIEQLNRFAATLQDLFISKPDVYVQRFKIISETTLAGTHQIQIEAVIGDRLLRDDLEAVGVLGPAKNTPQVLLMVAEAAADGSFTGWWAADPMQRRPGPDVGSQMAALFREHGVGVIDESSVPRERLIVQAGGIFPGHAAVMEAARRSGAAIVVLASTGFRPAITAPGSSLAQVQCDMQAEAFDVRTRGLLVKTSTNALGLHIDQDAAAQDAAAKACARIVEQILERMPSAAEKGLSYSFRCTFPGVLTRSTAHDFFRLLRAALPEIISLNIRETSEANVCLADVVSSLDGVALAHKALQADLQGYRIARGEVENNVINLSVTPPGTPQP